jgi:hypothetical protein
LTPCKKAEQYSAKMGDAFHDRIRTLSDRLLAGAFNHGNVPIMIPHGAEVLPGSHGLTASNVQMNIGSSRNVGTSSVAGFQSQVLPGGHLSYYGQSVTETYAALSAQQQQYMARSSSVLHPTANTGRHNVVGAYGTAVMPNTAVVPNSVARGTTLDTRAAPVYTNNEAPIVTGGAAGRYR